MRRLLPNEPCLQLPVTERVLTERHLLPARGDLEAFFLAIRLQLDPVLERLMPEKLGKPYPLGQCLEISIAAQKLLRRVDSRSLAPRAAAGLQAFRSFRQAGGSFRQVWGDLRGEYFQNAFQLGGLYVDVSNDTVVPTKPKVEVLPFEKANFIPVSSFTQFRKIARSYWQREVYPNHILPALAPHCPLILVSTNGSIALHEATHYMLAMTHAKAFRPSEDFLREPPMPAELFEQMHEVLIDHGHRLPSDPEEGRTLGLRNCRLYRQRRVHRQPATMERVTKSVLDINGLFLRTYSQPVTVQDGGPTLNFDGQKYELDRLSAKAKQQIKNIQFVDQELARTQRSLEAMQVARLAYKKALQIALQDFRN